MILPLLDRYIASTMLKATGMTLVVLVVLLVFFGLIDEMDEVGQGSYRLPDAFLVAVLSAPRYVFEAFPVAALLGSLVGLGAMAGQGELVAMRSAGYPLRHILFAVLKTGLLMMLAVFLFGEWVAPASEQRGEQIRIEKLEEKTTLKTRYGFWARDGEAFVNIRTVLPGGRLQDIFIYEFDTDGRLQLASHAARAEHQGDHWLIYDIQQTEVGPDGVSDRKLAEARWDSLLDPALLRALIVDPTMLPINELYRYIQIMKENGQAATDYEVAFWVKLATPLATMVMLFIAVPFVLGHQRFVSIGQRVVIGLMLGMAFYSFSRGMSYVSVVYGLHPLLSALLPTIVFVVFGLQLMRRVH